MENDVTKTYEEKTEVRGWDKYGLNESQSKANHLARRYVLLDLGNQVLWSVGTKETEHATLRLKKVH